jgi:hypothetical protein
MDKAIPVIFPHFGIGNYLFAIRCFPFTASSLACFLPQSQRRVFKIDTISLRLELGSRKTDTLSLRAEVGSLRRKFGFQSSGIGF